MLCYKKKKITCAAKQLRTRQLFEMLSYPAYSANNSLYNKDYTFSPSIALTAFSRVIYASFFSRWLDKCTHKLHLKIHWVLPSSSRMKYTTVTIPSLSQPNTLPINTLWCLAKKNLSAGTLGFVPKQSGLVFNIV